MQKSQRAAGARGGCGVGPALTEGSAVSLRVEVAFGAAEVLQHRPEVSPGLSHAMDRLGLALVLMSLIYSIPGDTKGILEGPVYGIMPDIGEWFWEVSAELSAWLCLKFPIHPRAKNNPWLMSAP